MKLSKFVKYLLSLLGAAALLYFAFRGIQWDEFKAGLQNCRWEFVLLAMFASVAGFYFRALRWRLLMLPFDPKMQRLTAFNGVCIGYMANFAFPRIGEVVRCGFISRRSHRMHADDGSAISVDNAIGTVLLSRCWDIVVVFLLLALLLMARWQVFGDFFINRMWRPFSGRLNLGAGATVAAASAIFVILLLMIWKFRNRSRLCRRTVDFIKGMLKGFASCIRMPYKGRFLIFTVLMWFTYWLMSMCSIWALPQLDCLNWIDGFFICLAGSVAWMIPVPGGFGAFHGIVALAVSSIYAMPYNTGLICATLNHESQSVMMLLCGIICYIIEITRKK